jgi:hypothetical protein
MDSGGSIALSSTRPPPGRLVEHSRQLTVDEVPGGQGVLQAHPTHDVTQRGGGQLLDCGDVVGDLVHRILRVGHLEVHDGVDGHGQVVLGDDRLWREGDDLLPQVDPVPDPVDEGHQEVQAWGKRTAVAAEPLDNRSGRLRDHHHSLDDCDDDRQQDDHQDHEQGNAH